MHFQTITEWNWRTTCQNSQKIRKYLETEQRAAKWTMYYRRNQRGNKLKKKLLEMNEHISKTDKNLQDTVGAVLKA